MGTAVKIPPASVDAEREADMVLRACGAFRAGSGIASPRRAQRVRRRETVGELGEAECLELGRIELWEEIDWIAEQCGLKPREKAVLSMSRLEEYTHREIADYLGLSPRRVAALLAAALRKAQARFEVASSPQSLFWEDVRQKSRCIYRKHRIRAAR